MLRNILFFTLFALSNYTLSQVELITNGSFESGNLTPWTITAVGTSDDGPLSCTENWRVQKNSSDVCTVVPDVLPADGTYAAFTSFNAFSDDVQWILEQEIAVPSSIVLAQFSFDFAYNADYLPGDPISIPRELRIDTYRADGTPFSNFWLDEFDDTDGTSQFISYSPTVDVSSLLFGLEGQTAFLRITATIPEAYTGPSKAMIDNISFLIDDGLSVDEFSLGTTLSLSPNPSSGSFTLTNKGRDHIQGATLYDITGKQLLDWSFNQREKSHTLNADLPSGVYLLQVFSESSAATKKLIIL